MSRIAMIVAVGLLTGLVGVMVGWSAGGPEPAERDISFLAGHWRAPTGGTVMEEIWFPVEQGTTTGMLRWIDGDGSVQMLELLSLQPEGNEVVFRLRHFDGAMKPWESEQDGPLEGVVETWEEKKIVIRCTERTRGVETITYDGSVDGELTATLEFEGEREPIVIEFKKVG